MKVFKKIVLFTFVMVWLILEAGALVAQDRYSTLIGSVKGIHVHG